MDLSARAIPVAAAVVPAAVPPAGVQAVDQVEAAEEEATRKV